MTDIEKALERWDKYARVHSQVNRNAQSFPEMASDFFIGWAHRELVRRGYTIEQRRNSDDYQKRHSLEVDLRCSVTLSWHRKDAEDTPGYPAWMKEDGYRYCGPTLLDCYLGAILATEEKNETE